MAYAQPFIRINFGGTLAGGEEIWSCSLHIIDEEGTGDAAWAQGVKDGLGGIAVQIGEFFESEAALVPNTVFMTYVTATYVGTDGKTIGESAGVAQTYQGDAVGASVPQAALVNTLVADKFKDPGKYNRFYLPVTNAGFQGSYVIPGAAQNAYLNALTDMVDDINWYLQSGTSGVEGRVGVVSNAGSGSQLRVSAVKLGRVIDTQRRRRNALSEAYVTASVPSTPTPPL